MAIRAIVLLAGASLLLGLSAAAVPASAAGVVQLPDCRFAGETVTADLSTTIPGNWSAANGPTHTSLSAWTALPANWIQPSTSATADASAAAGDYKYEIRFNIPCDPKNYKGLTLSGSIAADNNFKAYLNGSSTPFATCTGLLCFQQSATVPTVIAPVTSGFNWGLNSILVVVHNDGGYTGLAVKASLSAQCGEMCCHKLGRRGETTEPGDPARPNSNDAR